LRLKAEEEEKEYEKKKKERGQKRKPMDLVETAIQKKMREFYEYSRLSDEEKQIKQLQQTIWDRDHNF